MARKQRKPGRSAGETTDAGGAILKTKLHRPRTSDRLIARRRLVGLVDRVPDAPLTVVSAPAGYGKSILLSQWADKHPGDTVWLSLDEHDAAARVFLQYLCAAVCDLDPDACATVRGLLASNTRPHSIETLAAHLGQDLERLDCPCNIVLDDFQRLGSGSSSEELLKRLLVHPPHGVRFVIATRSAPSIPLARMRAGERFNEIGQEELRFGSEEARDFFAREGVRVSADQLAVVDRQIEGWAVGLRLLALALRHGDSPARVWENLRGGMSASSDYLLEEVLRRLPPPVHRLLLLSSIFDRFCEEALLAIAGDSLGAEDFGPGGFVGYLVRENLFAIPVDADGKWVRYHHEFRTMLSNQLAHSRDFGEKRDLHRIASRWFEDNGFVDDAIEQAHAGGDIENAAGLVGRNLGHFVRAGQWYLVDKWLSRLPDEVIHDNPRILVAQTYILYYHLNVRAIPPLLDRVEELVEGTPEASELAGEIGTFRGLVALLDGDGRRSFDYLRAVTAETADQERPAVVFSEVLLALAGQMVGEYSWAKEFLHGRLRGLGRLDPARETNLAHSLVFISYIDAEPVGFQPLLRRARRVAGEFELANLQPWNDYLDGMVALQLGRIERAIRYFEEAAQWRQTHNIRGATDAMIALALAYHLRGRTDEAQATVVAAQDFVREREPALLPIALSGSARLDILRGDLTATEKWLESASAADPEVMLFWFEIPYITRCRALIARGRDADVGEARRLLKDSLQRNQSRGNQLHALEASCLLATACHRLGDDSGMRENLGKALSIAEKGRFVFPFVEQAEEILPLLAQVARYEFAEEAMGICERATKLSDDADEGSAALNVAQLTDRERDVLDLLELRLQNKEIAERLGVSLHTVKYHLKHLYQKLGVRSRREAALWARDQREGGSPESDTAAI